MTNSLKKIRLPLKVWIMAAILTTIFCGLIYAEVQQNYRTSADDPQTQIAQDLSNVLSQGAPPDQVVPQNGTDMAASLQPFVIIYDATDTVVASSALLDGKTPTPPSGTFDAAKAKGETRFTWQPKTGVRIAVVMIKYSAGGKDGYVLAGRSLLEIEKRENNLLLTDSIAWVITLIVTLLVAFLMFEDKEPHEHHDHHEHPGEHHHNHTET